MLAEGQRIFPLSISKHLVGLHQQQIRDVFCLVFGDFAAISLAGELRPTLRARQRNDIVWIKHPFRIKGIDRLLPPGAYEVITDEEMIEGLLFASFRRVATMITVPAALPRTSTMEMIFHQPGRFG